MGGLSPLAPEKLRTMLSSRLQSVHYNSSSTHFSPISCGVPQGSVLGPILFILYISDVFSIINSFSILSHGYADDLQIYGHSPAESVSLLSASVVSCIDALNSWFSSNHLKLNPSKTEFI